MEFDAIQERKRQREQQNNTIDYGSMHHEKVNPQLLQPKHQDRYGQRYKDKVLSNSRVVQSNNPEKYQDEPDDPYATSSIEDRKVKKLQNIN